MPDGFSPRDCVSFASPWSIIVPIVGALVLLSVTLAFPVRCHGLIEQNKPVGSLEVRSIEETSGVSFWRRRRHGAARRGREGSIASRRSHSHTSLHRTQPVFLPVAAAGWSRPVLASSPVAAGSLPSSLACGEDPDHRYDDDGERVEYTDAMYARDLLEPAQTGNPYYFLYKDFERSHSAFKVHAQMAFKVTLLLPIMLLAAWPNVQLSVSLALVLGFLAYSLRATPFLDAEVRV